MQIPSRITVPDDQCMQIPRRENENGSDKYNIVIISDLHMVEGPWPKLRKKDVAQGQRFQTKFERFISHLDLMRLFGRAVRRSGVPVAMSQGFSPHPKISIEPALKLGLESRSLEARFGLSGRMDKEELKERLRSGLPGGIEILEAEVS